MPKASSDSAYVESWWFSLGWEGLILCTDVLPSACWGCRMLPGIWQSRERAGENGCYFLCWAVDLTSWIWWKPCISYTKPFIYTRFMCLHFWKSMDPLNSQLRTPAGENLYYFKWLTNSPKAYSRGSGILNVWFSRKQWVGYSNKFWKMIIVEGLWWLWGFINILSFGYWNFCSKIEKNKHLIFFYPVYIRCLSYSGNLGCHLNVSESHW